VAVVPTGREGSVPKFATWLFAVTSLCLYPRDGLAQGAISGTVTDGSTPLPGVTVIAASQALIERTRTAVTDGKGRYVLFDLRPGSYRVEFQLFGFNIPPVDVILSERQLSETVNAVARIAPCPGLAERETCMTDDEIREAVPRPYQELWTGFSPGDMARIWSGIPCESITFSRDGGVFHSGAGDAYRVELLRGGRASLSEHDESHKNVEFSGSVDIFTFGRLCYLLQHVRVERMSTKYVSPGADPATATLTAKLDGHENVVANENGSGPIELWAVEQAIDLAKSRIEWTRR
jgi:Carboxypeptidase regulatory-like domain